MRPVRVLLHLALLLFPLGLCADSLRADDVDYLRDIKPILEARCYACHGPLKQEQGLRLDTAAAIRQGGDSGPAVEAHQPGDSLLVAAVTGRDGWRMPPEGEPLAAEQVDKLQRWIDAGAASPADEKPAAEPGAHWAFQHPQRAEVPVVASATWAKNPIDQFLAAEHERQGVHVVGEADKATLLRRVYVDLIGLPPTSDELASFLADESPEAYEAVVDRLLASPQHGERWARHWMDIWRYSDWYGYAAEVRNSQPHIWRWRDWIVDSLNTDRGYDQMIVQMLAGDEVAPGDPQALAATGYLARNWYKFNRNTWLQDTVEHTGKAFLGLTFNCARCHDHKYDPISHQNYYELRAFFETHEVRADAVGGQLDRAKDGLARVYDAHLDRPTYLFFRGDEKDPDKDHPLAPGLPALLSAEPLPISPITLPINAWYPSAEPAIRQTVHAQALDRLAQAQQALAKLVADQAAQEAAAKEAAAKEANAEKENTEEAAKPAPNPAQEFATRAARQSVSAALANLLAVQAKIAADDAKLAQPPAESAAALGQAAGHAEKQAALADAQYALAVAEQARAAAEASTEADEEKKKKATADAQAKFDEAKKKVDELAAAAVDPNPAYTPFDKVYPQTSSGRRLALARWIASPQNPLTARVAVNHVWRRHFGQALVPTMFDFGMNGRAPSHPALLDWLAAELMDHNWSLKHLHRLMVTSATYRLASQTDETNTAIDPDNRLVWRMNVRRMDAEVVRDSLLHLTGSLDATRGGPELDNATADTTTRRSLYYRHANEKRVTFLELFDQPGVSEAYERIESIVPQQALALLNSGLAIERSRALAASLWQRASGGNSSTDAETRFVQFAFAQILGRDPRADEAAACQAYLRETTDAADSEQSRAQLVHVLFNHNDFLALR